MNVKTRVTPAYNIVLFVIWILFQSTVSILAYKNEPDMLVDVIFNYNVPIGVGVMLAILVLGAIVSVWLIKSFWERFVSVIFNVRQITVNEALSVVLVIMILTVN